MQLNKVSAVTRTQSGKGPARRLRSSGQIPAVAYSEGKPAIHLAVPPQELIAALSSEYGRNSLIELSVDGTTTIKARVGEYQYHPVSRELLHADFVEIQEDKPIEVKVPLRLTGRAQGIVMGGKLRQVFRELPIRSLPAAIPVEIVHDITELAVDGVVAVKDLNLAEGVEVLLPGKRTVAAIEADRRAKNADEEGDAKK